MIIHLAGAPGSGKTTLAKQVEKEGWAIYDLDDLNIAFVEGNNLIPLIRKNPKKVVSMYQAHINEIIEEAQQNGLNILFVGINSGLLGSPVGKNVIDLQAEYHVLLNVDTALNAKRWIQRDMPEVLDEFVKSLKDDIQQYDQLEKKGPQLTADFALFIKEFRPSQRRDDILRFKKYYKKQGYTFMSPEKFEDWFENL
jgi:adenylate kinase family enzyme